MSKQLKYKITIDIVSNSEEGFEINLDEAVENIKTGDIAGFGSNEDEEYSFKVVKEKL